MPFEYRPYQSPYAGTIASLIGRGGDIAAQGALARGQAQAATVGNIAKGITGAIDQYQAQKAAQAKAALEAEQRRAQSQLTQAQIDELKRKADIEKGLGQLDLNQSDEAIIRQGASLGLPTDKVASTLKTYQEFKKQSAESRQKAEDEHLSAFATLFDAVRQSGYSPESFQLAMNLMERDAKSDPLMASRLEQIQQGLGALQGKTPEEQTSLLRDLGQSLIAQTPGLAKKLPNPTSANPVRVDLGGGQITYGREWSDGSIRDEQGRVIGGMVTAEPKPEPKNEYEWVVRAGKPMEIVKGSSQAGDIPYHPPSEKAAAPAKDANGKPLATLEVRTLKEFDQGLGQIQELTKSLNENKATGALASFEANWLPNVVTEMTGIGAEAKGRQAMIELAKQIVGKGLEGGVLRKEDELKYARMMPTMSDAPDVAASKLGQLQKALERDRQRYLDLLSETGRDVSKVTNPFGTETPQNSTDKNKKSIKVGGFIVEQE